MSEVDIARKKLAVVNELVGICENIDKVMQESQDSAMQGVAYRSWQQWKDKQESVSGVINIAPSLRYLDIKLTLQNGQSIDMESTQYIYTLPFGSMKLGTNIGGYILANDAYGGVDGVL